MKIPTDEHDPVTLPDRDDPERNEQNEVQNPADDEFHVTSGRNG
jgi:hypothetical protein